METKGITRYDYVIVGGGPCGLAFAQCCCELGKKVIVIEKESSIGGCHGVDRETINGKEYYFTEHGPRVYSTTYKNFQQLLKNMNYKFSDLFVPYNFQMARIGNETIQSVLKWNEALELIKSFLQFTINTDHGKNISMKTYMENKQFSEKTHDMIERLCRLTDGGESTRYTLNKFLNLFNQQFFYQLYQPKTPNDNGLFKIWKKYLESKSVEFLTDTFVTDILVSNGEAVGVNTSSKTTPLTIFGNDVVLAIPPSDILKILDASVSQDIQNCFMEYNLFKTWVKNTRYLDYISVTFHFTDKLQLPKVYGFPKSDWGLAFIVLSDYMTDIEPQSKTVISTVITFSDSISKNNNKTANQCIETELIVEAYNQLREAFPNLPLDNYIGILAPGTYKSAGRWVSSDTAFISVADGGYLPMDSKNIKHLYNVGTHNGSSKYQFTSLESAVTNAISLAHKLLPETKKMYTITSSTTVTDVLRALIVIALIVIVIVNQRNV
jgi:predicted NAD/FAD-dependent oxidoreductase